MDSLKVVHDAMHRAIAGVLVGLDGHASAVFDGSGEDLVVGLTQSLHPPLEFIGAV